MSVSILNSRLNIAFHRQFGGHFEFLAIKKFPKELIDGFLSCASGHNSASKEPQTSL